MRSRHCKDEPAFKNVTGEIWEGESEVMSPSQENCLFDNHRYVPTSERVTLGWHVFLFATLEGRSYMA